MKLQAPCYKCVDREVNCHSKCDKYAEYKDTLITNKNKSDEFKSEEIFFRSVICVATARRFYG